MSTIFFIIKFMRYLGCCILKFDYSTLTWTVFSRFEVGDWVKFKRSVSTPSNGWQGANHKSVGFVQNVVDKDNLVVSFCTGEASVLTNEVWKLIPLDRGQHVRLKPEVKEPR